MLIFLATLWLGALYTFKMWLDEYFLSSWYPKLLICACINSIRNKFDQLKDTVLKYIDILILTETKRDETFLISQFLMNVMNGFSKPYSFHRNKYGGGVMPYIRDTIPSNNLEKHSCLNNSECLFIELNFRKCRWLHSRTYHPPSQNDEYYFNYLDKALDSYSNYEKVLLVGDFNTEITEHYIESFLYKHELRT